MTQETDTTWDLIHLLTARANERHGEAALLQRKIDQDIDKRLR